MPALAACLGSEYPEVRRLTVVTLAAVSRSEELLPFFAADSAAQEGLQRIAVASAETDPRLEKQAREPLKNAEAWKLLQAQHSA
jgi:hypothetical protein